MTVELIRNCVRFGYIRKACRFDVPDLPFHLP